ncbi:MAG: branched-chain amino acid ABC transporter substrate-binding protein [Acidobacteriota bacterium]
MSSTTTRLLITLLTLSVLGVASLFVTGCSSDTVKIGVVVPETGPLAIYGKPVRQGIEIAYQQILADKTFAIDVELEFRDSESDPEKAAQILQELYRSGAMAAIGGVTSGEALAMVDIADGNDRVLISPTASAPELTGASSNFFRVFPSDLVEANKMAAFAAESLSLGQMVVVAEQQTWGRGIQEVFAKEFERYGGEIVEVIEYPPNTSEFTGFIDRILTLAPDAVYLAGYEPGVVSLIRKLHNAQYAGKVLTTHAFSTSGAIAEAGEAASGVVFTQSVFEVESDYAHIRTFVDAYQQAYGEQPDIFAAHGYDAANVLFGAFREVPPQLPSDTRDGLRAIKEFPGVTGSLQFDERGDVTKFPRVYTIDSDLSVFGYDDLMEQKRREIMRKKQELLDRMKQIDAKAEQMGDS